MLIGKCFVPAELTVGELEEGKWSIANHMFCQADYVAPAIEMTIEDYIQKSLQYGASIEQGEGFPIPTFDTQMKANNFLNYL